MTMVLGHGDREMRCDCGRGYGSCRILSCRRVVVIVVVVVVVAGAAAVLLKELVLAGVFVAGPMLRWVQTAWRKLDNSKTLATKYLPALGFAPTTQVPPASLPVCQGAIAPWPPCRSGTRATARPAPG